MKKAELQNEVARIRALSPQEFVKDYQLYDAEIPGENQRAAEQRNKKWQLYLASATDLQLYYLAKCEFRKPEHGGKKDRLEAFLRLRLGNREEFARELGIKAYKDSEALKVDVRTWADQIIKVQKEGEAIAQNPEKRLRGLYENQDFGHRA